MSGPISLLWRMPLKVRTWIRQICTSVACGYCKLQNVCRTNIDETWFLQKVWLIPLCPIKSTSVLPDGENAKHRQWVSLFDLQWCGTMLPPACIRRRRTQVPVVLSGHCVPRDWVLIIVPSLFQKLIAVPSSIAMTEYCPIACKGVRV